MEELIFAGNKYISSKRASKLTGYATDYVGQMCREEKIDCKLVGRNWYINEISVIEQKKSFKRKQMGDSAKINYKKIELEPIHYINDNRDINIDIAKDIKEKKDYGIYGSYISERIEQKNNTSEEKNIQIHTINRFNNDRRRYYLNRKEAEKITRRNPAPLRKRRIGNKIPSAGIIAVSMVMSAVLFVASTFLIDRVTYYKSSSFDSLISEFQFANVSTASYMDSIYELLDRI